MSSAAINLTDAFASFDEIYSPRIVGRINDYDVCDLDLLTCVPKRQRGVVCTSGRGARGQSCFGENAESCGMRDGQRTFRWPWSCRVIPHPSLKSEPQPSFVDCFVDFTFGGERNREEPILANDSHLSSPRRIPPATRAASYLLVPPL